MRNFRSIFSSQRLKLAGSFSCWTFCWTSSDARASDSGGAANDERNFSIPQSPVQASARARSLHRSIYLVDCMNEVSAATVVAIANTIARTAAGVCPNSFHSPGVCSRQFRDCVLCRHAAAGSLTPFRHLRFTHLATAPHYSGPGPPSVRFSKRWDHLQR
jgi:hypothetical protein